MYLRSLSKSYWENKKLTTLSSEISRSHNVALLSKRKDLLEKEFYMKMSRRNGRTYRVLIQHIKNGTYEKTIISQWNFEKSLLINLHSEAKLAIRDDYALPGANCPPTRTYELNVR